jgi:Lrp/AsnC family leucine-responsive transcriptional regulator
MDGMAPPQVENVRPWAGGPYFYHKQAIMQVKIQLDDVDARILTALSADSRRSYADVAAEVGLSTAAVHERVRKMLERGVIERFSLRIDPERVGLHFTAFVAIRNDGGAHCREIAPRLRELPEVLELHSVAGEHDFIAKIRTTHARALEDVLYAIKAIPGVARTTSTVVLNTEFEERPLRWPGTA